MRIKLNMDPSWELFVAPALSDAGLTVNEFVAAFVEFPITGGHRTLLNDDARPFIAIKPVTEDLRGQDVRSETIDSMEAEGIADDSGWLMCVRTGIDTCAWAFDYRRNLQRTTELIALARQYSDAARSAVEQGWLAPATELTFGAMELAVFADLLLDGMTTTAHHQRVDTVAGWSDHGTYPSERVDWLRDLWKVHRPAARYGEGSLQLGVADLSNALDVAEDMINEVERQCGDGTDDDG